MRISAIKNRPPFHIVVVGAAVSHAFYTTQTRRGNISGQRSLGGSLLRSEEWSAVTAIDGLQEARRPFPPPCRFHTTATVPSCVQSIRVHCDIISLIPSARPFSCRISVDVCLQCHNKPSTPYARIYGAFSIQYCCAAPHLFGLQS